MRRKDREVSDIDKIKSIIEKCKVCHLAMVDNGAPYVVPLSFGYVLDDGLLTLYLHSAKEGRKIDILRKNNKVCFEMACEGEPAQFENPCNAGYYFESVIGFGRAEFIEDVPEKCRALSLLMKQQTGRDFTFNENQADSVCVFKVTSKDFTGKIKPAPGGKTK